MREESPEVIGGWIDPIRIGERWESGELFEIAHKWVMKNPLCQEFCDKLYASHGKGVGCWSVADAIANREILAAEILRPSTVYAAAGSSDRVAFSIASLSSDLVAADIYVWKFDLYTAACAMEMPGSHEISESDFMPLGTSPAWFQWDGEWRLGNTSTVMLGMLVARVSGAMHVAHILQNRPLGRAAFYSVFAYRFKAGFPIEIPGMPPIGSDRTHPRWHVRSVLSLLAFLRSPAFSLNAKALDRTTASRCERRDWRPQIRFIDLRRRERVESHSGGECSARERAWRWVVSGHMRSQWFPKTESHRLIYIDPYVKGPEGKPLKPKAYRVVR